MSRWTEKEVEKLKKLWVNDGMSASQIAARIGGGVTRNAVIAKVHRLGLSGRSQATSASRSASAKLSTRGNAERARKNGHARPFPTKQKPHHIKGTPLPADPDGHKIPKRQRKTIQTLESDSCRWPVGDPKESDFYFCGGKAIPTLPYCVDHARRAFETPKAKTPQAVAPAEASNDDQPVSKDKEVASTA